MIAVNGKIKDVFAVSVKPGAAETDENFVGKIKFIQRDTGDTDTVSGIFNCYSEVLIDEAADGSGLSDGKFFVEFNTFGVHGKWFANTAILGVVVSLLQTVFVLSMSYTLSRLRFSGRKTLMNFMLILGMFPGFLTLILVYKVFADLGLTEANAPLGLIIVYCASSGMGYYVSKGFFDTIPKTLDEAARVDGATRWQVFYKVIMPLSKPIVIYTILMGFMAPWGDFMMANYLAHENPNGKNVAVGMFQWLERTYRNERYTAFCAGGVCVSIPVTAVFLALQKYYVEGVTGGAVKG